MAANERTGQDQQSKPKPDQNKGHHDRISMKSKQGAEEHWRDVRPIKNPDVAKMKRKQWYRFE